MAVDDRDNFGFYRVTIGNLGFAAAESKTAGQCSYNQNATCLTIGSRELSMTDAGAVLSAMEVLQIFVFFIGVLHLYRTALSVSGRNAKTETSITDYSIMITDLPPDVTDVELLDHFSSLYRYEHSSTFATLSSMEHLNVAIAWTKYGRVSSSRHPRNCLAHVCVM